MSDFTEALIDESRNDPGIFVSRRALWDVKPGFDLSKTFSVFVGDASRPPRVLKDDEQIEQRDAELVLAVPSELRRYFQRDPNRALADLAAVPTRSSAAFIADTVALAAAFSRRSVLSKDLIVSGERLALVTGRIVDPRAPRFVHVDAPHTRLNRNRDWARR